MPTQSSAFVPHLLQRTGMRTQQTTAKSAAPCRERSRLPLEPVSSFARLSWVVLGAPVTRPLSGRLSLSPGNCRAVGSLEVRETYQYVYVSSKKPPPLTEATTVRATRASNLMRVAYRTITPFR